MSTVIHTENLGKRYRLGVMNSRRLYDDVQSFFLRLRGKGEQTLQLAQDGTPIEASEKKEIWAIRGIDLEVKDGDVLGVIGRNGSGKSTLLKVLSRITAPTMGSARLRGRVASLLEVGTGFNGELTGRENIYLNGSILGMTRADIDRHYDEIVEFSGVERFLNTPVKRYSSGMFVRLAFAVAAHLDPDILIVDEVLAVGDAAFQRKCLTRISDVARQGRTILFVSHQAAAVEHLCTKGVVLDAGRLVFKGSQTEALDYYVQNLQTKKVPLSERKDRRGTGSLRITDIEFRRQGQRVESFTAGADSEVHLHFEQVQERTYQNLKVALRVGTLYDAPVFTHHNQLNGTEFTTLPRTGIFVCSIPRLPLPEGAYRLNFMISANMDYELVDAVDNAMEFHIEGGQFFSSGELPDLRSGVALIDAEWSIA
ncbi:MAG: ABC transporter ATP-binding protein [Chthoniobacterales bacterium]